MTEPQLAPFVLQDLLQGGWKRCAFEPFRDGIEICRLVNGPPDAALLKYEPGAHAPRHRHMGLETILMIEGEQSDERGAYPAGTFVANPEGSEHSVWSAEGCVALLQWERPVMFLD